MSGRLHMLRGELGFTVIELLATMAIMGTLLAAFGQMLITTSKSSARTEEQATLQDLARTAISGLTRDLREATNTLGTSPVESLSTTTVTFDAPDEATPFHLRRIAMQHGDVVGQIELQLHAADIELVLHQPDTAVHDLIDVAPLQVHGRAAGEGEQVFHQVAATLAFALDQVQAIGDFLALLVVAV